MKIKVETVINQNIEDVWKKWITPEAIVNWNFAQNDWSCPKAENDFRVGGKFVYNMAANNGSMNFDYWGNYTKIVDNKLIEFKLGDERMVEVRFEMINNDKTKVVEIFDAENVNSVDRQKTGWQAILNNFKKYCEK